MGGIKRLTVAVVVNYKHDLDKHGKTITRELNQTEKDQITALAKEAMGFNSERGDSLNVVNTQFILPEKEVNNVPFWKQQDTIDFAIRALKYIAGAIALLYLFFAYLKPLLKKIIERGSFSKHPSTEATMQQDEDGSVVTLSSQQSGEKSQNNSAQAYKKDLAAAQQLAKQDPKIVANVVKNWINE